jgi:ankyrin repeat protein
VGTDLSKSDPVGVAITEAIRAGDVTRVERMLDENPKLGAARICGRTLLHIATDWPGHFPNGVATVATLIRRGADVNARFSGGRHTETPLHWAASSNDVPVLDALLDHGADIEAAGAVIGGGTPLADAVAFGQWDAARRLIERGARANLWQAAALGLMDRVRKSLSSGSDAEAHDLTVAFWCACHGGQRAASEYLLENGAELNWKGYDGLTPLDAAIRSNAHDLVEWLREKGAVSADRG